MPITTVEANDKAAEVRVECDNCGQLVVRSIIAAREVESKKLQKITCYRCK
jgi:hypothetical protein